MTKTNVKAGGSGVNEGVPVAGRKRPRRQGKITDSFGTARGKAHSGRETAKLLTRKRSVTKGVTIERERANVPPEEEHHEELASSTVEIFDFVKAERHQKNNVPVEPAYRRFAHLLPKETDGEQEIEAGPSCPESKTTIGVPAPSEKRKVTSPVKREAGIELVPALPIVPAYQRFAHLLDSPSLPLPSHFQLLDRILGALDSVCMVAGGRDQPVIWSKSVRSLEAAVGRRVEEYHLEQLQTLGPFYKLRPVRIIFNGRRVNSLALELPETATHELLWERRRQLRDALLDRVHKAHEAFLKEINAILPPGAILKKWHPRFDLESVPDVTTLPKASKADLEELAEGTPEIIKDVIKAVGEAESAPKGSPPISASSSSSTSHSLPPKTSVLERIKARQKEAEVAAMVHDPLKEALRQKYRLLIGFSETVAMYGRLKDHSSAIKIPRLFATSSRSSMLLGDVISKISQGSGSILSASTTWTHRSVSSNKVVHFLGEITERIESLVDIVPGWIKIVLSGGVKTLRLDRAISLSNVRERLEAKLRELS